MLVELLLVAVLVEHVEERALARGRVRWQPAAQPAQHRHAIEHAHHPPTYQPVALGQPLLLLRRRTAALTALAAARATAAAAAVTAASGMGITERSFP